MSAEFQISPLPQFRFKWKLRWSRAYECSFTLLEFQDIASTMFGDTSVSKMPAEKQYRPADNSYTIFIGADNFHTIFFGADNFHTIFFGRAESHISSFKS
jgi:hypothetical protein